MLKQKVSGVVGSLRRPISVAAFVAMSGLTHRAVAEIGAEAEAPTPAVASAPSGSIFVDPLGFALFGPRLGVEVGAGRVTVGASARWFNAGLLSQALFFGAGYDSKLSFGAGLRGRYYLADGFAGGHLGIAAEYLSVHAENPTLRIATRAKYIVPYLEAGYRLPFGRWYADASAGFGYAARTSSSVENILGGSSADAYRVEDKSSVYGTASLELGLYF